MPQPSLLADLRDPECAQLVDLRASDAVEQILSRLDKYAFVRILSPSVDSKWIEEVSECLHLGEPYVAEAYKGSGAGAVADINATIGSHPAFSSGSPQAIHVDGTLDEIGLIRTTLLYCMENAASGGSTVVFNAPAVWMNLQRENPRAAETMTRSNVLARSTSLPGVPSRTAVGPAIKVVDGEVLTRFALGTIDEWRFSGEDVEFGAQALIHFTRWTTGENRYRRSIDIQPGECFVFRNDHLSHSRDGFVSKPGKPRHLLRALYTEVPTR